MNNDVLLTDLPPRWAHYSLLLEPISPPILVVQMELEPEQWLYVAALLPVPDLLSGERWLSEDRMFVMLVLVFTVIGLSLIGIRWVTRPLANVARAADVLGYDLQAQPVTEAGPREIRTTAKAFNRMQARIRQQVEERERLFSAISHDLKTPITRLRLRAEMLEDAEQRTRFIASLDELDLLVRGALASVKGMDLHENPEWIEPGALLHQLAEDLAEQGGEVRVHGDAPAIRVKPVAFKRCLANLLENAVFYGQCADVYLQPQAGALHIIIRDQGPGIPAADIQRVFEPYVRLERSRSRHTGGTGLGLGIARHILQRHGGRLALRNHPEGGLEVSLSLPTDNGDLIA
ncbi:ATP-binding protein [Alkalilimnicola ehrlichii]|uniref:ATP-binding protein n=1 Tax=Alkalilimnicola ehrlichii TaxID=351052 RepID=UPI001C6F0B02|nr:ATP-binding protein [Alkalilimnicola ehrlichii]